MKKLSSKYTALFLALGLGASGCTNHNVKGAYPSPAPRFIEGAGIGAVIGAPLAGFGGQNAATGALVGGVIGGALGSYMDSEGLKKVLEDEGISVIELGQYVEIVIPVDKVFKGGESEILLEALPVLEQVVFLMKQYGPVNVKVSGYTDNIGSTLQQLERSRFQSESLTNYLWSRGIDIQRVDTTGYGQTMTAASDHSSLGSSYNRRLIICFFAEDKAQPARILTAGRKQSHWLKNSHSASEY